MPRLPELLRAFQGSEKNITAPPTFRLKGEWGTTRKTVAVQCCLFFADEKLAKCTAQFPPLFLQCMMNEGSQLECCTFATVSVRPEQEREDADLSLKQKQQQSLPEMQILILPIGFFQLRCSSAWRRNHQFGGLGESLACFRWTCDEFYSEIRACFKLKFESLQDALKIMFFAVRTHMERNKHQASIVRTLLPAQVLHLRFLQEATTKNPQKGEISGGGFK